MGEREEWAWQIYKEKKTKHWNSQGETQRIKRICSPDFWLSTEILIIWSFMGQKVQQRATVTPTKGDQSAVSQKTESAGPFWVWVSSLVTTF